MYLHVLGLGGQIFEGVPTEKALKKGVSTHLHCIMRHFIQYILLTHLLLCLGWIVLQQVFRATRAHLNRAIETHNSQCCTSMGLAFSFKLLKGSLQKRQCRTGPTFTCKGFLQQTYS